MFLLSLLALFTLSVPAYAQTLEPADTAPSNKAGEKPQKRPRMPNVITYESAVGQVSFPHKLHQKMGCQKCHHQIQAEPLITPHGGYLESSWINCQICHSADAETRSKYYQCSQCHQSNVENIADETLSSKVVVHKSCWECHKTGKGVKASESCETCHEKQQKPTETSFEAVSPEGVSGHGEPTSAAH